jgi:hypothetical protein
MNKNKKSKDSDNGNIKTYNIDELNITLDSKSAQGLLKALGIKI